MWKFYRNGIERGTYELSNGEFITKDSVQPQMDMNYIAKIFRGDVESNRFIVDPIFNRKFNFDDSDFDLWTEVGKAPGLVDYLKHKEDIVAFYMTTGLTTEYLIKDGYQIDTPLMEWDNNKSGLLLCDPIIEDISMRDGIKLSTMIILPNVNTAKKFPVVLCRTPYGKKGLPPFLSYFVEHGYVLVMQDVRGRYDSEGVFVSQYYEKKDGFDTLDWISEQPWCNGSIGTIGGSYSGYVQWAMATQNHPNHKAIISQVTGGSPFVDIDRRNGGMNMGILAWNRMMSGKENILGDDDFDWDKEVKTKSLACIFEQDHPYWHEYLSHPTYDEFWEEMDICKPFRECEIPALIITGWHDGDILGSHEAYGKVKEQQNVQLIIGPWEHRFNNRRYAGEMQIGANGLLYNMDLFYLKWFDKYLKGIDGFASVRKVKYYIEGFNNWMESDKWPPSYMDYKTLYLNNTEETGTLILSESIKEGDVFSGTYTYDPLNATPQLLDPVTKKPFTPMNYAEHEQNGDMMIFTSKQFEENTSIVGIPRIRIYASSSSRDTDWVARLTRVDTFGNSYRITDGYLRARFRDGFDRESLLEPGKIYEYNFDLLPCAIELKADDRIRLQICSAQNGEMIPNTNTGNPVDTDTDFEVAEQTIYFGGRYQSHIYLPITKTKEILEWMTD